MAISEASLNGLDKDNHAIDHGLGNLSLSSKAIHADDFLNNGTDVAPPIHVSTTFRYNRDPDALKSWAELQVSKRSIKDRAYQLTNAIG